MSKPTSEQLSQVSRWVAEGATLAEVQSRLASEFGLSMTYMDVRFLVDDLGATLVDKPEPKVAEPLPDTLAASAPPEPSVAPELAADPAPVGAAKVSVTVDTLARPGAIISGKVTFSDAQVADWYVDEQGRPGLVPATPGYRPSPDDIRQFQMLLEAEFQKRGY